MCSAFNINLKLMSNKRVRFFDFSTIFFEEIRYPFVRTFLPQIIRKELSGQFRKGTINEFYELISTELNFCFDKHCMSNTVLKKNFAWKFNKSQKEASMMESYFDKVADCCLAVFVKRCSTTTVFLGIEKFL